MSTILIKRLTVQGFIIFDDYAPRYPEFSADMQKWLANQQITYREDLVTGLANAPEAFIGLLQGSNFGKLVIQVGPEEQ